MKVAPPPDEARRIGQTVGVTDINLMFEVTWSDMAGSDYLRYSAKDMIGDPDKDGFVEYQRATEQGPLRGYVSIDDRLSAVRGRIRFGEDALHVAPDEGDAFTRELAEAADVAQVRAEAERLPGAAARALVDGAVVVGLDVEQQLGEQQLVFEHAAKGGLEATDSFHQRPARQEATGGRRLT